MSCGGYFYVYALVCPIDNEIRYVGCTDSPDYRFTGHVSSSEIERKDYLKGYRKSISKKAQWILSLATLSLKPELKILLKTKNSYIASEVELYYMSVIDTAFNYKSKARYTKYYYSLNDTKNIPIVSDEEQYAAHQWDLEKAKILELCPNYAELDNKTSLLFYEAFRRKYHPIYNRFTQEDIDEINQIINS